VSARFSSEEVQALLALPRPDTKAMKGLDDEQREQIENRIKALEAALEGASEASVAKLYGLHRKTVRRMVDLVDKEAPDGSLFGFQVCMPHARLVVPQPKSTDGPLLGRAHDLVRLLGQATEVGALLGRFKGPLPTRKRTSPRFDRLCEDIRRALAAKGMDTGYPFNTRDKGRRAFINFIARDRKKRAVVTRVVDWTLTKWTSLATIRPFEEVQIDAHPIDCKDLQVAVPLEDGTYVLAPISRLWLIAEVDVGSRACLGWRLVADSGYTQFDLTRCLAHGLTPWAPKDVEGLEMRYFPNAWMPSANDLFVPRPLRTSLDNASSHLTKHAMRVLREDVKGVYRFGVAGIPETRGVIEAFFKLMEQKVLRFLAGGFEPETKNRLEQMVSSKKASDHPVFIELLEIFLDIAISRYNITPHTELANRSPREAIEHYLAMGGMPLRSTRTAEDVRRMRLVRKSFTIRGSKDNGKLPHVNLMHGIYRSDELNTRWDLIGVRFDGLLADDDARYIDVLNDRGVPFMQLEVLPPYARSPHTLEQRHRAHQFKRAMPGLWDGMYDHIEAMHRDIRREARRLKWAADEVASGNTPVPKPANAGGGQPAAPSTPYAAKSLNGLAPRGGPVRLR
jgi:transposase InsO family protein